MNKLDLYYIDKKNISVSDFNYLKFIYHVLN